MLHKLSFFAFAILLFQSCSGDFFEQVVNIDPPVYEKSLVVHATCSSRDTAFRVRVTRNFGLLDVVEDSAFFVKNAVVQLYKEGQLVATAPESTIRPDGWYEIPLASNIYEVGKTYELKVSHPDFPGISGTQTMPALVSVDSVRYRKNGGISPDGSELFAMDAFIKDEAGVRNYYGVYVTTLYFNIIPIFDDFGNFIRVDTIQDDEYRVYPETSEDPNAQVAEDMLVLTDQFFDGQAYKISFKSYAYDSNDTRRFKVYVRGLTEDYYLYLLSEARKGEAEDLPLAEPVTVHTNLGKGIGIFGMYSEKAFLIE
jgi:hypothetical protein